MHKLTIKMKYLWLQDDLKGRKKLQKTINNFSTGKMKLYRGDGMNKSINSDLDSESLDCIGSDNFCFPVFIFFFYCCLQYDIQTQHHHYSLVITMSNSCPSPRQFLRGLYLYNSKIMK